MENINGILDAESTEYCPECGWNMYRTLWPGNNGLVVRQQCSFCGRIEAPEVK